MTDLTALGEIAKTGNPSNLVQARRAIVTVFERARMRSQDLHDDLEALGPPDIEDGQKFQDLMESAAAEIVGIFDDAVEDARALPTNDANAFVAGVGDLTARFREAFDELGATFDRAGGYDTGELNSLFAETPACGDLS